MINLGASLRGYLFSILLVWVALATLMSLYESIRQVGMPLMRVGRPLTSLVMTVLMVFVFIGPTMQYIVMKLMGMRFDYEKK